MDTDLIKKGLENMTIEQSRKKQPTVDEKRKEFFSEMRGALREQGLHKE